MEEYVSLAKEQGRWRENAIHLSERYLREGLVDRAVTRDLPNGVPVPVKGYEDKKIYVWIEAVTGYYAASKKWALEHAEDESQFWNANTIAYYVHGKDNVPFHSIIWPAILRSVKKDPLPTHIVSNEFLTIEQKKLSTSRNWAIWVPEILDHYHPDSIRYFLLANAPEKRDSDFSWREFVYSHNSELLGAYGNFVNRTLKFVEKSFDGITPSAVINKKLKEKVIRLYDEVGRLITNAQFKKALEEVFSFVRESNKYFDDRKPWIQIKDNVTDCAETIANCVYILANLSQLLHPFLPFSSDAVQTMLGIESLKWEEIEISNVPLEKVNVLFERIDLERVKEEVQLLKERTKEG